MSKTCLSDTRQAGSLLALIFVFAAIFRFPFASYSLSMQISFEVGLYIVLAYLLWGINKGVSIFLVCSVFSMFYPSYSRESYDTFNAILLGAALFYAVSMFFNNSILDAVCVVSLANIWLLFIQWIGCDIIYNVSCPVGFLGNPNHTASFLAIAFPAFIRPGWKKYIPVVLFGLVLSKTTLAVVSLIVGMLFFSCFYSAALACLIIAFSVIFSWAYLNFIDTPTVMTRLVASRFAIDVFSDNLFGVGLGSWKSFNLTIGTETWTKVHNEYLQALVEMGWFFIISLGVYIVELVKSFNERKIIPATALVIAAVNCAGNFNFHIATSAMLILTWMGMYEAISNTEAD